MRRTSTTVIQESAKMVEPAPIKSMISNANASLDSLEKSVKETSMIVNQETAKMVERV